MDGNTIKIMEFRDIRQLGFKNCRRKFTGQLWSWFHNISFKVTSYIPWIASCECCDLLLQLRAQYTGISRECNIDITYRTSIHSPQLLSLPGPRSQTFFEGFSFLFNVRAWPDARERPNGGWLMGSEAWTIGFISGSGGECENFIRQNAIG